MEKTSAEVAVNKRKGSDLLSINPGIYILNGRLKSRAFPNIESDCDWMQRHACRLSEELQDVRF